MNEYVSTVVILPPSESHQHITETVITEISPLTHHQSLQQLNIFSQNEGGYHVSMETSSRNVVLRIILDFFLMATRKQKLILI